jgi:hypothetical protein
VGTDKFLRRHSEYLDWSGASGRRDACHGPQLVGCILLKLYAIPIYLVRELPNLLRLLEITTPCVAMHSYVSTDRTLAVMGRAAIALD